MTTIDTPVDDYFRSHLPNQTEAGGRKWLYPKATSGRYTNWRMVVSWVLLACLFAGPMIWVDGHPLFLFNVLERRFIFFGVTFWPQDFYLVAIGLITFIVFVVLFTVVFGRVFCGWACPQTIFMEMVFRKIEGWIEGDFRARQRLDAAPWTPDKMVKKTAKHSVFFLISFLISNTFLAYLIGRDQLLAIVTDSPANHTVGLFAILIFTGVFYLVFARLREIVCTTICPYGRLQGVMLDKNSLTVAYDFIRGEPRGKKVRGGEGTGARGLGVNAPLQTLYPEPQTPRPTPKGDCIDCNLCVQVCPTGIDIRNGIQLECINCTACMDACDEVMDKIDRPRGLIRIDSLNNIEQSIPFRVSGRIMAYSAVLLALLGLIGYLLASRQPLDLTVLRAPGQLYQRGEGQLISNLYSLEVINKTYKPMQLAIHASRADAKLRFVQPLGTLEPGTLTKVMFFIDLPERTITQNSTPLTLDVATNGDVLNNIETTFLGPVK
ncbi:cytochrome c oxidase accessory protein CcoG [Fibrivirga algicola]|uniref:Cytochrome c oxidase accessory protein CcoG n=1 Tax=Fibrivirga algicola TaxID=2950420 RepID=A0ABX0QJ71_9BACT|nr:cytochrome c oxidase accessory protein CcoG [Fibrivirga algicola]NID10698.1 cytochrome c oxidase accessory protein CcoG [Fibrivirga algicola]